MANSSSTTPSAQSLSEELDNAIVECVGMTGCAESRSSESSIAALKELRECLIAVGDQPLDAVQIQRIRATVPLPARLHASIPNVSKITDEVFASRALSDATRWPQEKKLPSSAVQRATSQSQGGSSANTPPPSEAAGSSGLTPGR